MDRMIPTRGLLDAVDLPIPNLPEPLEGFRIAHLTDLHARRPTRRLDRVLHALTSTRFDLICLTGDLMDRTAEPDAAERFVHRLEERAHPTHGMFGVFGNHDRPELIDRLTRPGASGGPPRVRWLRDETCQLPGGPGGPGGPGVPGGPFQVAGLHRALGARGDAVAMALRPVEGAGASIDTPGEGTAGGFRLLLSHHPSLLPLVADMGYDLMLSGHTHGGQVRLPLIGPMYNSSPLPLRLTSGVMRCRGTLAAVSRGVGEAGWPIRICCPPHIPVYTLRRDRPPGSSPGSAPGSSPSNDTPCIERILTW